MGQRAEVESGARWLEAETGDYHTKMELGTGRPEMDPHHQLEQTEDKQRDRQKLAVAGLGT